MNEKDEYGAEYYDDQAPTMFGGYPITGDYTMLAYPAEETDKKRGITTATLIAASSGLAVTIGAVAAAVIFKQSPEIVTLRSEPVTVQAPTVTVQADPPTITVTTTTTAEPSPQTEVTRTSTSPTYLRSETVDQRFLRRFVELTTLTIEDPKTVIGYAHEQCKYLSRPGATASQDVDRITKTYTSMTREMSWGVVASAIEAYCPQYMNEL